MSDTDWPQAACRHCPRRPRGLPGPCVAQVLRNPHICDHANPDHATYDPRWVARLCGDPEPAAATVVTTAMVAAAPPRANPHAERHLLILACDYRSDALDECSCTGRRHCGLARGAFPTEPYAVSYSDCLRCVTASPPVPTRT